MFKRKNTRTKWLNTIIRIEQIYAEGYVHEKTSEDYIWFTKTSFGTIVSKTGLPLRSFTFEDVNVLDVFTEYAEHRKRVIEIQESNKLRVLDNSSLLTV